MYLLLFTYKYIYFHEFNSDLVLSIKRQRWQKCSGCLVNASGAIYNYMKILPYRPHWHRQNVGDPHLLVAHLAVIFALEHWPILDDVKQRLFKTSSQVCKLKPTSLGLPKCPWVFCSVSRPILSDRVLLLGTFLLAQLFPFRLIRYIEAHLTKPGILV